jgi:NAD(P)H dehydrogenase (quinone)
MSFFEVDVRDSFAFCHLHHSMKKILVINGHPNPESLNNALADAYINGAKTAGAEVKYIIISDLDFNPNLQFGYQKRTELEPDLLESWDKILWADHLVWIHPTWWGGMPAIMKGFLDRLFLPGMAFRYRENSVWWDKLLTGKTARIITTMDQPGWYYYLVYARPGINQLKRSTLQFCGIDPVKVISIGIVKTSTLEKRLQWIKKVENLGRNCL